MLVAGAARRAAAHAGREGEQGEGLWHPPYVLLVLVGPSCAPSGWYVTEASGVTPQEDILATVRARIERGGPETTQEKYQREKYERDNLISEKQCATSPPPGCTADDASAPVSSTTAAWQEPGAQVGGLRNGCAKAIC